MSPTILITGGLENIDSDFLSASEEDKKYETITAHSENEALDMIAGRDINIVISGTQLPSMGEKKLTKEIKTLKPQVEVIFLCEKFSASRLVGIIRAGAYEMLKWPAEPVILTQTIRKALEKQALSLKNRELELSLKEKPRFSEIIGKSKEIKGVLDMVSAVSARKGNVLICGESGTGKELVARAIHQSSSRSREPFIKINCAALSDGILESELFGHEKGAFTGATSKRVGRFELADKGTLFIDEVSDIPMSTQVKLLRVLQEREFERVGGNETMKVDVRIIAATNRELLKGIEEKTFREDLYYRLNVIQISMPPLRKRKGDIPLLVSYFIDKYNEEEGHNIKGISKDAMQVLMDYRWPGNIRELENAMQSAMTLATNRFVEAKYLPSSILLGSSEDDGFHFPFGTPLKEIEEEVIYKTLERLKGNRTKAASALGISLRTIQRKLAQKSEELP